MGDIFHPIIYVRGYAMSQGEINDTTADPFCGFNLGSTVYRATPDKDKPAKKFIFESPVIRLHSDFDYADVFEDGQDIMDDGWVGDPDKPGIPRRSIIVYHYYEQASTLLGKGKTPSIETFAKGLNDLILRVKTLATLRKDDYPEAGDFRCHLVAHSMGGLVCRAFLQNPALGSPEARDCVDKFFTYATPHNGIEMAGINVPSWLGINDINNFNDNRMADYLNLAGIFQLTKRVDWIPEEIFPSRKVFCMVGTNRNDYEVAMGASRTFAGHGSDGLVRIENASVWGCDTNGKATDPCATAYTFRSHSGYFGIVNSEEAYQNLIRFLFGDLRIDISAVVTGVQLPNGIAPGATVDALYQFEILAAPRGKRWYLTRRTAEEDSVACCSHQELIAALGKVPKEKKIYLSSVFLGSTWIVVKGKTLAYSVTFGVRVPDYEVNKKFWFDGHYEGGYLFRDTLLIEMTPPQNPGDNWQVNYGWQSRDDGQTPHPATLAALPNGRQQIDISFGNNQAPGIKGSLSFTASAWS